MKRFVVFSVSMSLLSLFLFIFLAVNFWTPSLEVFFSYVSIVVFTIAVVFFSHYLSKFLIEKKYHKLRQTMTHDEMPAYLQKIEVFDDTEGFKMFLSGVAIMLTIPWVWFSLIRLFHIN